MKKIKLLSILGWISISFLTGCTEKHAEYIERACLAGTSKETAMNATENILGKMHFTIDKSDAEYGYISTQPLRGAQSFELWRSENVGSFNSAEANLHTIRRTIEMNFTEETGQLCIDCIAKTERLSLPEKEVVSPSGASSMFTKSNRSAQRLALNRKQEAQMRWIDLGRDNALETEILSQLKQKISHQ